MLVISVQRYNLCRNYWQLMNYLAHIYLSGENRRMQIGNFIGDAVKGNNYQCYPEGFQQGILLHRQIDSFADTHPLVREAVGWGREVLGRYSAVVTDIFFDHFLAQDFRRISGRSLRYFSYGFYMALIRNYRYLPQRFQGFLWHFILTNRLGSYASLQGIGSSLAIMVEYRGLQVDPRQAIDFLNSHYVAYQSLFREFFPELQAMCNKSQLMR